MILGGRGVQDGAKLGSSWVMLGLLGPLLGSSWHLEAILPASCPHDAILEPSWSHLGGNLAELKPLKANLRPKRDLVGEGSAECAKPLMLRKRPI